MSDHDSIGSVDPNQDLESRYGSGFKQTKLILYTKEKKRNIMFGELYGELEASLRAWTFFFVIFLALII